MAEIPGRSAISGFAARMRSLWRGLRRRADVEAEMHEEFRVHVELRAQDLVRGGLAPADAMRQARIEFGNPERYREQGRASRGLRHLDQIRFSWLDVKLGGRMLVRYPGLTLVAGLAMAFAIAAGAATFELVNLALHPTLPLPGGDRIVGLTYWDRANNEQAIPTSYDVLTWRAQLETVEDVGGFRLVQRNLFVGDDAGEPVEVAEISASAFRVARVPPLLGRALVAADESPGAPPVVVLGFRLWQRRFNGDSAVVGRVVRLGDGQATVVGVMPAGFAFPIDDNLWMPLRLGAATAPPAHGVPVRVFGRLAPGATMAEAQSEASALGARAAVDFPDQYEHLRAQVLPYPQSIIWISPDHVLRAGIHSLNGFAALLLLLICGNVALLMFARAATREREILVRNALGASRGRIMMQLFAEALVLCALAALLGLTATSLGLHMVERALRTGSDDAWPFWFNVGLSGTTVLYAGLLTLVAAALAGIVPAWKVTGRGMETRLRHATAGAGGLRMGGIWTGLIIAQIAATVVFTAVAYVVHRQAAAIASVKAAFPAREYLAVRLEMERKGPMASALDSNAAPARYAGIAREMEQRLSALPSVAGVTVAQQLPLMPQPNAYIEVEGEGTVDTASGGGHLTRTAAVAPGFFHLFQASVLAGRGFDSRDLHEGANTVVVNAMFVDRILAGRNPIGRRIRYVRRAGDVRRSPDGAPERWYEIVGVVRDLVPDIQSPLTLDSPSGAQLYHPLGPSQGWDGHGPLYLAARVRGGGDPMSLAPTLRRIAADVSPELLLRDIRPLDQATSGDARGWRLMAGTILLAGAIALVLSLAGIYSVLSFTVARRTREIGVRVALGAQAPRVVFEIFRRPLGHVAVGVVIGCVLVAGLVLLSAGSVTASALALLVAYAMVMLAVCAMACIGPTVRALRVEPTEALSAEV